MKRGKETSPKSKKSRDFNIYFQFPILIQLDSFIFKVCSASFGMECCNWGCQTKLLFSGLIRLRNQGKFEHFTSHTELMSNVRVAPQGHCFKDPHATGVIVYIHDAGATEVTYNTYLSRV